MEKLDSNNLKTLLKCGPKLISKELTHLLFKIVCSVFSFFTQYTMMFIRTKFSGFAKIGSKVNARTYPKADAAM